ncbi:SDR family NAD(P)-dependent oxidoreductase [Scopulibacillus cellulosilyticus]|uniref:SDR family NAD(P)-dependent oxidoreductase n=1 Tax=Scopulibacillus cellulosilyticus TaxID=2665665 RepID=A0ABW2Q2T3_9BACL
MAYIIITGGGSGLGRALALQYGKHGYTPILLGRNESKLLDVKSELAEQSVQSFIEVCDLNDIEQIKQTAAHLQETFKQIDFLINNAGIGHFGPLQDLSDEKILSMIDTNIKGTIFFTKYMLPALLKNKKGKILNIISTAGLKGKLNESVYCATKFAIRGFSESLKLELADSNITVVPVYMGGMNTPFWESETHIKDTSRLVSAEAVAKYIYEHDDGRQDIYVDKEQLG